MTTQVEKREYKSIQEKERMCAEMTDNQFPYQKEAELKYPKARNEQENPDASRGTKRLSLDEKWQNLQADERPSGWVQATQRRF